MNAINQISGLFFPKKIEGDISFDSALHDLATQRVARIAKTIFFTIASIALTVSLILTEIKITLPIAIPALITILTAGLIFYRLNSLDNTYVERLTDSVRENCVKKELERIFLSQESFTQEEIKKTLNGINLLLKLEVFDNEAINKIIHLESIKNSKSLAEMAVEKNQSIAIDLGSEWIEQGRFSLPSYELNVGVKWSGKIDDTIVVKYCSKEKKENEEEQSVEAEEQAS